MNKKLIALLSVLAVAVSMVGCGDVSEPNDSSAVQSSVVSEEAKETSESISDLPEIEPVPIPEGGWTEETISEVIYINGKNVKLPCKFEYLGDGFEINIDEHTSFDNNYAFVNFKYNNIMIGGMAIDNCADVDSLKNGNIISIECVSDYLEDGSNNFVPIEINSVTLGSTKTDVEKHLDFDLDELEANKIYYASQYIGKYHIWCLIKDDIVTTLHIQYIENMEDKQR